MVIMIRRVYAERGRGLSFAPCAHSISRGCGRGPLVVVGSGGGGVAIVVRRIVAAVVGGVNGGMRGSGTVWGGEGSADGVAMSTKRYRERIRASRVLFLLVF